MSTDAEIEAVKNIIFVGDGAVGKTSLLYAFSNQGGLPTLHVPTIYDENETEITVDNVRHCVKLVDTAGQEDYDRLRIMSYKQAHCFVLCYSIANRTSFNNILMKWFPELSPFDRPIVLVGTKMDAINLVDAQEGHAVKQKINANQFIECSAKNNENINEVIYGAVRAIIAGRPTPPPKKYYCCVNPFRQLFHCKSNFCTRIKK